MVLITNRTHADCERARYLLDKVHRGEELTPAENAEYFSGLRGSYTMPIDWNRVESAVSILSKQMGLGLVTKTDWTYQDIATASEIKRYLGNIRRLYDAMDDKEDLEEPPTIDEWIDYRAANRIEKILARLVGENTQTVGILESTGLLLADSAGNILLCIVDDRR